MDPAVLRRCISVQTQMASEREEFRPSATPAPNAARILASSTKLKTTVRDRLATGELALKTMLMAKHGRGCPILEVSLRALHQHSDTLDLSGGIVASATLEEVCTIARVFCHCDYFAGRGC